MGWARRQQQSTHESRHGSTGTDKQYNTNMKRHAELLHMKRHATHENDGLPLYADELRRPLDQRVHDAAEEVPREPLPHDGRVGVVLGQNALHHAHRIGIASQHMT